MTSDFHIMITILNISLLKKQIKKVKYPYKSSIQLLRGAYLLRDRGREVNRERGFIYLVTTAKNEETD